MKYKVRFVSKENEFLPDEKAMNAAELFWRPGFNVGNYAFTAGVQNMLTGLHQNPGVG
jgi:hypothetical protein